MPPDAQLLPVEFRIFSAGVNESTNGPALFDDAAAARVMATYQAHGVRLMIDLEHKSLDGEDCDARGWFDLEMRNGELWAVNVVWTPDGARRIAEGTQRYISPAFDRDDEMGWLINVALVAMPATLGASPLIAWAAKTPPAPPPAPQNSRRTAALRAILDRRTATR